MVHKERTVNAMLYAIGKYPNIGRTKLMKFFFFSDLINYNQNGDILLEKEYMDKSAIAGTDTISVFKKWFRASELLNRRWINYRKVKLPQRCQKELNRLKVNSIHV